jgi:hypothetical protein
VVQCFTGPAGSVPAVPVPVLDVCGGLLELFSGVPGRGPDGRSGQAGIILRPLSWRWPRRRSLPG